MVLLKAAKPDCLCSSHHLAGELVDINNKTVIFYASIIAQWAN
jgi:hypothetical protein